MLFRIIRNGFRLKLFNYFLDFFIVFSRKNEIILIGIHSEQSHNTDTRGKKQINNKLQR